jgi:hypothetical protein
LSSTSLFLGTPGWTSAHGTRLNPILDTDAEDWVEAGGRGCGYLHLDLGHGPVMWPPDPGDPVAWRDRLIRDHIGPLIQRDAVSRASAVQLSSLIGLFASKGGRQPWLEQLRPNLSGALSIGRRRSGPG